MIDQPDVGARVRAELSLRAEADGSRPVTATEVRSRARRLRRRQRVAAGVAAVVGVGMVAVPLAMAGASHRAAGPDPAPDPAGPSPTQSRADDERESVRNVVDALPLGSPPRIGYTIGRTYVGPDGTERLVRHPNALEAFTPYRGGVLATEFGYFEGSQGLVVLGPDLKVQSSSCTLGPPAVSSDGERVWWATGFCPESGDEDPATIHTASVSGTEAPTTRTATAPSSSFVRMLGPLRASSSPDTPVAYATSQLSSSGSNPPQVVGTTSDASQVVSSLELGLDAAVTGLIAGRSGPDLAVVDVDGVERGTVLWRERSRAYDATFSPSGRYLVAGDEVFDAWAGTIVARLDVRGATTRAFWEDDRHLLLGVGAGQESAVVRFDVEGSVDGDLERAVDWRRGREVGLQVLP